MLAINLLPVSVRPIEGTPPARLALVVTSVVFACGLAVLNSKVYTVDIPVEKNQIRSCDAQISDLSKKMDEVKKIDQESTTIQEKVVALSNLEFSRMRYGRLFDCLSAAMPDGVWLTSFTVSPEMRKSDFYHQELGGKRYQIALAGWTTGETLLESSGHLTELLKNMHTQFGVPNDAEAVKVAASGTVPQDWGLNKMLGARFDPPMLLNTMVGTPPIPPAKDGKTFVVPKTGEMFRIHFCFEMPVVKGN